MSAELLLFLAERYAFDPTPSFGDLGAYHVPFDDLVRDSSVEQRLRDSADRGERAVLIAESGAGKSTVISSVLGNPLSQLAPIVVPVRSLEGHGAAPSQIADEMLRLLSKYAKEVNAFGKVGDTRTVTNRRRHSGGMRLALGWLQGDLAREVTAQTSIDSRISLGEKSEVLAQVLTIIHRAQLMPVVVFDDTDRWLLDADRRAIDGFFGEVVRWLTEFPLSVVVAAHGHYLADPADAAKRLEFLDTPIHLPALPDSNALRQVLARRVELNVDGSPFATAGSSAVFNDGSLEALFSIYREVSSLRRVIQVVHAALAEATSAGSDSILTTHIEAVYQQ